MSADLLPGEGLIYLPLGDITEGDRVRTDLGNIRELADSIASVGLLHPIVITPKRRLVAGGRRLSAVRSLGWSEVPVRVVDITTAEKALRAEADENTCRKELTSYEASDMRRRQAEVLAPVAAENKGGRPSNTAPKLGEVKPPKAREVAKTAAIGTGYSGSSLDKVDHIRDVAERGVIRHGKTETPAPAPVIAVAREALAEVKKPGAPIDRAYKKVVAAQTRAAVASLTDAIDQRDPSAKTERDRATLKAAYSRGMKGVADLPVLDAEAVALVLTDTEINVMAGVVRSLSKWAERVVSVRRRAGLTLIEGEAK